MWLIEAIILSLDQDTLTDSGTGSHKDLDAILALRVEGLALVIGHS